MKKLKQNSKIIELTILIVIFFLMYILNHFTPLIADDYGYSLNLDKNHLTGIKDIINFQIVHYKYWGGRTIAHTIAQTFLMLPKWIFNLFNPACLTLLIYLIYTIVKGQAKDKVKNYYKYLIIIFLLIYFVQPVFGQTCLWLIGSCNYLWTTTIVVSLIAFYLKKEELKDNAITILSIFLYSIIAGWTNENTAFGLLVILMLILINKKKENKKITKWNVAGIMGIIVGFVTLLIAPGNYIRSSSYNDDTSFFIKILNRFFDCTSNYIKYLFPLLIIFIIGITIIMFKKKKINKLAIIFGIGSIFTLYPMILSPSFPKRAWFSIIIFGIIAVVLLLIDLESYIEKKYILFLIDLIIVFCLLFFTDYIELLKSIEKLHETWEYRIKYIKENPNKDQYEFEIYNTTNSKNPNYDQYDIAKSYDQWPNTDIEKYFKINKILGKD